MVNQDNKYLSILIICLLENMYTDIRMQRVQGFDLGLFLGLYFRIIITCSFLSLLLGTSTPDGGKRAPGCAYGKC